MWLYTVNFEESLLGRQSKVGGLPKTDGEVPLASCTPKAEVAAVQSLHATPVVRYLSRPVPLLQLLLDVQHSNDMEITAL